MFLKQEALFGEPDVVLVCDAPACAVMIVAETEAQALRRAKDEGWRVYLGHFCPTHKGGAMTPTTRVTGLALTLRGPRARGTLRTTIWNRVATLGWSDADAVTTPPQRHNRRASR